MDPVARLPFGRFRGEASLTMQSVANLVALIGSSPLSVRKDVGQRTSPVLRNPKEHSIVNGTRLLCRFHGFIQENPQTPFFLSQRAAKMYEA